VRVRVPELTLREIDIGSPVQVYFPALDKTLEVPITRIGNAVDSRTRTIELIIEVPNSDMRIKSGMSVEVGLAKPAEKVSEPSNAKPSEPDAAKPAEPSNAKPSDAAPPTDSRNPTAMIVQPAKAG
jgi:multidrug efflux pump subunit AcrA (membrane-fusion protein)